MKKRISMKTELIKNTNNNTENVQNIIKQSDKINKIQDVIKDDLEKQQEDFKKKLDEKRKKGMLSTSDVMDHVNVIVNLIKLI